MIRGFFDEILVAERPFGQGGDAGFGSGALGTPGVAAAPGFETRAYRQLRFASLDVARANVDHQTDMAQLDKV